MCLLLFIPNTAKLIAPEIDFSKVKQWDRNLLEQMIYQESENEGFNNPVLLIKLAEKESNFLKYPKIVDTNGKLSIGLYHFQETTFDNFCVKKYKLEDSIEDPVIQTRCAIRLIQDNYLMKMWYLSTLKIQREIPL